MKVQEIHIAEQKQFPDVGCFPFVFGADKQAPTSAAVQWVKDNKAHIEDTLLKHGAILFREFPIDDAAAYSEFIEAFGYDNLPYIGGAAPRKQVIGNVYTANEAPPEADIPFHHEMSQVVNWPKKLFFYGDVAPTSGGETPICLSNEVYKRMVAKHKDFVDKLEKLGVKYTRIMPADNDETSPQGRGWKATYGVTTKEDLEIKLVERSLNFEWLPSGDVKVVSMNPLAPVQIDSRTGQQVWFNSIVAIFTGWNDSRHVGSKCVTFGDGSFLDYDTVYDCRAIMDELCVNHQWQHGDVLMIDNRTCMHARRPFTGSRKVYAYLTKN